MTTISPDLRRLADCLRPALALERDDAAVIDADVLALAMDRHRVAPLLFLATERGAKVQSAKIRAEIDALRMRNLRSVLQKKAASINLVRLLHDAGIETRLVKGWELATQLYGEESLRHAKDVDLLLRPEDMPAAIDLAAAHGYRSTDGTRLDSRRAKAILRFHREVPIRDPKTGVELELHRNLLANPPKGWSDEGFFTSRLDLSSPAYVLYLILHGAGSNWKRLKWLCDLVRISQLTSQAVRDDVITLAHIYDCAPALSASFELARILWADEASADWRAQIGRADHHQRENRHLRDYLAALNRNTPLSRTELLARRVEVVRDTPIFGNRHTPRWRAIASRTALWWLRKV